MYIKYSHRKLPHTIFNRLDYFPCLLSLNIKNKIFLKNNPKKTLSVCKHRQIKYLKSSATEWHKEYTLGTRIITVSGWNPNERLHFVL